MKVLGIARSMSYTVAQRIAFYRNIENVLFETCAAYDPAKISANKAKTEAAYLQALRKAAEKQTEALKKAREEKSGEKLEKEKAKIAKKYEEDIQKAELKRDSAKVSKGAKKEPFYFDANRGPNSDARDVGFSTNDLGLETLAAPAAEFLTLVGLQRAIPEPSPSGDRLFDYHLWQTPVPIALLAAAINGLTDSRPQLSFRFESWYRTSQRKHKAFLPAKAL
jgi:CRISPR-associated protein Csb3